MNTSRYIKDGTVDRERIALDVRDGRISHAELETLVSDPSIKKAFFGVSCSNKRPQSEWNEDYLRQLSYSVVSDAFNADYLFYLEKVASTVRNNKAGRANSGVNKGVITAIAIAVVVIVAIVLFFKK